MYSCLLVSFKSFVVSILLSNLNDLIKSDIDFKNYYESVEERYEDEEKMYDELTQPIVIVDGELIDGYSRASYILRYNDEPEIKAYINI